MAVRHTPSDWWVVWTRYIGEHPWSTALPCSSHHGARSALSTTHTQSHTHTHKVSLKILDLQTVQKLHKSGKLNKMASCTYWPQTSLTPPTAGRRIYSCRICALWACAALQRGRDHHTQSCRSLVPSSSSSAPSETESPRHMSESTRSSGSSPTYHTRTYTYTHNKVSFGTTIDPVDHLQLGSESCFTGYRTVCI